MGTVACSSASLRILDSTMDPVTERIAFDESVRVLESQEAVLTGLRGRAGTLLAAASLVTTFLAPAAVEVRDAAKQTKRLVFADWRLPLRVLDSQRSYGRHCTLFEEARDHLQVPCLDVEVRSQCEPNASERLSDVGDGCPIVAGESPAGISQARVVLC